MYWFSSMGNQGDDHKIMKVPMYGKREFHILHNLPGDTHFAIDYYDRKIYWTGASDEDADHASEIKSYKLDTDDIPDDKVIRSLSR